MCEIADVTTNLRRIDECLWVSNGHGKVSYPAGGNESCFTVEEQSFWFRHRNEVITRLVGIHAPGQTLFDIGAGNGYVSLALQRTGIRSVVVEPGRQGIDHARARGLRFLVHSTFHDVGFRPESVGAFGLFDVLEHIEDPGAFLSAMRGFLRPGGVLFVTVPALGVLWSSDDEDAGHYRRYSRRALSHTLTACGFSMTYCSYFFCVLAPAVFVGKSIPSRLGVRRPESRATFVREHSCEGRLVRGVLDRALAWEARRIRSGRTMPIGSSCLAVAHRR